MSGAALLVRGYLFGRIDDDDWERMFLPFFELQPYPVSSFKKGERASRGRSRTR
jgi:hypothetical protein